MLLAPCGVMGPTTDASTAPPALNRAGWRRRHQVGAWARPFTVAIGVLTLGACGGSDTTDDARSAGGARSGTSNADAARGGSSNAGTSNAGNSNAGTSNAGTASVSNGGTGGAAGTNGQGLGGIYEVCLPCSGAFFGGGGYGFGGGGVGGGGAGGGSAGGGGTGNAGGSTADVDCHSHQPAAFPSFDRSCSSPSDCTSVVHQVDCCGSRLVTGIKTTQVLRFNTAERACSTEYPVCDCPTLPTTTDTGQVAPSTAVPVECVASLCTTYAP
jgi:hypothetical protein